MDYKDLTWEEALKESHKLLLKKGPRSPKKLIPPHQWIKETMKKNLGEEYEYYAKGESKGKYNKEYEIQGLLYPKKVDVAILRKGKVVGVISFKFVASNYKQNSNNYFENLIGECFNIQANHIPFCHVFVLRSEIPYYNENNVFENFEEVTEKNLDKYLKLSNVNAIAVPSKLSISIIDIKGDTYKGKTIHPKKFGDLQSDEQEMILNNIEVTVSDYSNYSQDVANKLKSMEINKILKEFSDIIKEYDLH